MKTLKIYFLSACLSVFLFGQQAIAKGEDIDAQTFFIDFGQDASTWGDKTTGADINGNIWNNVVAPSGAPSALAAGATLDMVNSQGEATTVKFVLVTKINSNGKANGGLAEPDAALLGDLAVGTATNDYFFLDDGIGNQGWFRFEGLDNTKAYKFHIFGARQTNDVRGGTFLIYGDNKWNGYLQTSGAGIGTNISNTNDNTVLVSAPVVPNAEGKINFEFFIASSSSKFAYISAMKIEEVEQPEASVADNKFFIDFGKNNSGLDGALTVSPDKNGNYWNNVYSNGDGATNGTSDGTGNMTLKTSENTETAYAFELSSSNAKFNGVRNGGLLAPSDELLGDLAIATATHDYLFTDEGNPIVMLFKNLDRKNTYRFNIFGSRADDPARMSIITLEGENTYTAAHQTTGKHVGGTGVNGNNRMIYVSDVITPDEDGQIKLTLTRKFGMAHINVMKIEEFKDFSTSEIAPSSGSYELRVGTNHEKLIVTVNETSTVSIYNMLGILVNKAEVEDSKTFALPAGSYIINSVSKDGKTRSVKALNR